MNRQIQIVTSIFIVLFAILVLNLTYIKVIAGPSLAANPANTRAVEEELTIARGKIITSDGVVLAESRKTDSRYTRSYPAGNLAAHVVGYSSYKYQKSGLEEKFNSYLLGKQSGASFVEELMQQFNKPEKRGNNLILTIDSRLQKAAQSNLEGKKGAVVILDPKTGAVLAMAANPTYDPNRIEADWQNITRDENAPLVNRATEGRYPPGSSFKIITAAAALEEQVVDPDTSFTDTGSIEVMGVKLRNYGGTAWGQVNFRKGFEQSINTVFAQVGLKLGAEKLVEYAKKFGFNTDIPFELPLRSSYIQRARAMDDVALASSAFGQAKVIATPMEMALATATIANNGAMMKPFVVKEIQSPDGEVLKQFGNEQFREVISADTVRTLTDLMVGVVESGTGGVVQTSGMQVAAKTGTAETGIPGQTHAWFISFAPADDAEIAIAVVVEKGGTGAAAAGPIAKNLLDTAIENHIIK